MTLNLDEFDAILLDLDGTVYHEEHSLPGAVDLIQRLQIQKRRFACLTNSTSSPSRLAQRLDRMGVTVEAFAFLMELRGLGGREALAGAEVVSFLEY